MPTRGACFEAERLLISADVRRKKRKQVVDAMAAVLILQAGDVESVVEMGVANEDGVGPVWEELLNELPGRNDAPSPQHGRQRNARHIGIDEQPKALVLEAEARGPEPAQAGARR